MPVSTVIAGGMSVPGFTRVANVPRHWPPRNFTAASSVTPPSTADPPVVSRSTTQNTTSWSGVPRSSKERCTQRTVAEHVFDARERGGPFAERLQF